MSAKRLVVALAAVLLATAFTPSATAQAEYCSDITRNTQWGPDRTHIVGDNCTVNVRGSTLTILPGTLVQMGRGANLVFQEGAELIAQSSADAAIRVLANTRVDEPGYWGQIRFETGAKPSFVQGVLAQGNVIVPVLVSSGGHGGVAMVDVRNAEVRLDWVVFQKALDAPLAFDASAVSPSLEAPGQSTVGGACQRVQLANNTRPGIVVHAEREVDIDADVTWHDFCVPYLVDEELRVAGPDYAVLKLDVGVSMSFGPEGSLVAGLDEENPGQLELSGTPTDPIVLTGHVSEPGAWRGVRITEYGQASALYNATIEYGGRDDEPMVTVLSAETTALGVLMRHAKAHPLQITAQAVSSFTSSLADITGEEPPAFVDNGVQAVQVLSAANPLLTSSSAWGDIGVPYELDGSLVVAGVTGPRMSILPGAELVFPAGARLVIGDADEGSGELAVHGEPFRPAVLTAKTKAPGSWGGVAITRDARIARIDRAVIEYGGAQGPMVDWGRAMGDISRVTFRGAAGYPIAVPVTYAYDVVLAPEVADEEAGADLRNTFQGNGTDRVLIHVDRDYTSSLSDWSDPGAPVELDDTLVVSSPTQPLLQLNQGLRLVFRPGKGLILGNGAEGRAALLVALDDPAARPVTLGPVDPEQGWAGLRVRAGSNLRASGPFQVLGVGADAAAIEVDNAVAVLGGTTLSGQGRGTGLRVLGSAADVTLSGARITGLRVGLQTSDGARLAISRSIVEGNTEWGFRNDDPTLCLKAPLVYWGSAGGPHDPSDAWDGCLNGANPNPEGDKVSDDVDWWPYAVDTNWTPSSGLGPNPWRAYCPYLGR